MSERPTNFVILGSTQVHDAMPIKEITATIERLRQMASKHEARLSQSEALTKAVLVEPMLRLLGWDTSDPDHVRAEEGTEAGRPDYLLDFAGEALVFVEAKKLGTRLDAAVKQGLHYANTQGVPWFAVTDGAVWELYEVFRQAPIEDRKTASWNLRLDSAEDTFRKALALLRGTKIGSEGHASIGGTSASTVDASATLASQPPRDGATTLQDVVPTTGTKPPFRRLVFSDGTSGAVESWSRLLVVVADWLARVGKLKVSDMPIDLGGKKRYLLATTPIHKHGKNFISPVKVSSFWIETHASAEQCLNLARKLLSLKGIDPSSVRVE